MLNQEVGGARVCLASRKSQRTRLVHFTFREARRYFVAQKLTLNQEVGGPRVCLASRKSHDVIVLNAYLWYNMPEGG